MSLAINSSYADSGLPWLKGNLHAHTTNSDGTRPPQTVVERYAALGYDFLMISDHDQLTDPASVDARGMALIPGNEVTARGPHILQVDLQDTLAAPSPERQEVINAIVRDGGLAVMAHPNWEKDYDHCPLSELLRLEGYAGIEIFNGVCRILKGEHRATDKWDRLLSSGRRVWGFANDDSHAEGDDGLGWNVVQSAAPTREAIMDALRKGRFYASTGVVIDAIEVEGDRITIRTQNAQAIAVISDFGRRHATFDGKDATLSIPEDTPRTYFRFECHGPGEAMAWTQPVFVERI